MKFKIPYHIKRAAFGVLPLLMLMGATPSCKKNRSVIDSNEPTPPQIEQHDDTIHWDWWWFGYLVPVPPMDSVAYYTKDPTVRHIYIDIIAASTNLASTFTPTLFHNIRGDFQSRIDLDPNKVRYCGTIKVGRDGAQIHPDTITEKYGMWEPDSLWYAQHGLNIERFLPLKSK